MRLRTCWTNSKSKTSRRIQRLKDMRKTLDKIAEERSKYSLREEAITNQQEVIEGRTTFSAVNKDDVLGRGEEATEIINRLLSPSDTISIIPIVGIGGLGKTTLAKLIFNDDRIKNAFEPKIWVHAMDFKVEKLVEDILLSSGTTNRNSLGNLESKVQRVKQILNGRRYLIVLDDVWNEDWKQWEPFKQILQGGERESRIIVTTRSKQVLSIMHAETPHMLKHLSYHDRLELFERRAFGSAGAKVNLVSIGKQIVKKCQGVPLTANTLGGMLCFKSGEDAWKEVLDSEFWELEEEEGGHSSENEIISSLKLSYQYMPSPLKLCFVYCSLYPKAFELDKDMLIQQWIAQRFIQKQYVGDHYVNYLLAISFLEETELETYKMHDLVYDLARSIAGDEVAVLEAKKSPKINPAECLYASIIEYSQLSKLQKDLPRKVRALHYQECSYLSKEIFSYTKCLRVLDLNNCSFGKPPTSVYKLKQLRYLKFSGDLGQVDERIENLWNLQTLIVSDYWDISTLLDSIGRLQNLNNLKLGNCHNFRSLPESLVNLVNLRTMSITNCRNLETLPESLANLINLEILNINNCSIITLPISIGKLYKLVYLDLSFSRELSKLPDSIGSLQKLYSLKLCGCYNLQNLPESLSNLIELRTLDIKGCAMLDELPNTISNMTKIQREESPELGHDSAVQLYVFKGPSTEFVVHNITNAKRINLRERGSIKSLMYECDNYIIDDGIKRATEAMVEALQPHQNLQELCIQHYECLIFPSWMRSRIESFLPNLVKIKFIGVHYCKHLPVLGQLPKLEEILIKDMHKVRRINEEFCGDRNTSGTSFPSLRRLGFFEMWGLEEWVTAEVTEDGERGASMFPCLEELNIYNCPKLRVQLGIPPSVKTLILVSSMLPLLMGLDVREMSLKHLRISSLKHQTSLLDSIRHLTSLETLEINFCKSLATLPEWLGELSSLRSLEVYDCPLINCLPESIQRLTALETLDIAACSENLWKRTEKEIGTDWYKISHIQNKRISTGYY
ncbi:disease resistance protein RGA2-like isoform X2 [Typha latifolia]|uniref:disease resistance protein RGA2-like isoform X2 n=1 Tax=Typha latifolia TaxID=4733 RepID=UPI003C30C982